MTAYKTVVVGTDGSKTSYIAVDRAASVALGASATLVITCAYHPIDDKESAVVSDQLRDEAYHILGSSPAEETLRTAYERVSATGVTVDTVAMEGEPIEVLLDVARAKKADLLVVGNRGLNTLAGRILGSVPSGVARRADCDVLIVHTT